VLVILIFFTVCYHHPRIHPPLEFVAVAAEVVVVVGIIIIVVEFYYYSSQIPIIVKCVCPLQDDAFCIPLELRAHSSTIK
jgi:hypothetical protein